MEFIDIPTEQTTAATDALLALVAFCGAVILARTATTDRWKAGIWTGVLVLLAIAAMLGTIVHGFQISNQLQKALWHPLFLCLGLLVGLFLVATITDLWGKSPARKVLPFAVLMGIGFYLYISFGSGRFLMFIIYQMVIMLFALGGYMQLAASRKMKGAWLISAGIFITLFAAWVQGSKAMSFTLIWAFDHNGVYHLLEILAVLILLAGVRKSLGLKGTGKINH